MDDSPDVAHDHDFQLSLSKTHRSYFTKGHDALSKVKSKVEDKVLTWKWDDSDVYDFSHKKRGVALIICNEKYQEFADRNGAAKDVDCFEKCFLKLGFTDIRIKFDMTATDLLDWFTQVSHEDHSNSDCLMVAITSHGDQWEHLRQDANVSEIKDVIICSQGSVTTQNIVETFSDANCPSLTGKPRMFILQACRGQALDSGVEVLYRRSNMDVVDSVKEQEYTVSPSPCFKDFCLAYATPPGHFAFRRPSEGSWFVKALWDVIKATETGKVNFERVIRTVIQRVGICQQSHSDDAAINGKKQIGCFYSMLTKDIYFNVTYVQDKLLEECRL